MSGVLWTTLGIRTEEASIIDLLIRMEFIIVV